MRHQLDPRGKKLAELYKSRAELLEIVGQFAGLGGLLWRDALLRFQRFLESGFLDQIGTAVLNEEPRDLAVTIEMLRF